MFGRVLNASLLIVPGIIFNHQIIIILKWRVKAGFELLLNDHVSQYLKDDSIL